MEAHRCIMAIDPDSDKSGLAVLDVTARQFVSLCTLSFPELICSIRQFAAKAPVPVKVYVEAGWMCPSNWHITSKFSRQKCAAMGVDVGRNQETGRKIIEMLTHYGIAVSPVRPLIKVWGKHGHEKISHAELSAFAPVGKRTNQEERDAALLAWDKAGLPMVVPVRK